MKPLFRIVLFLVIALTTSTAVHAKKEWTLKGKRSYKPQNQKILAVTWSRALKAGSPGRRYYPETANPVVSDNIVYVGTQAGFFYAIDGDSGKPVWKYKNGEPVATAAGVDSGRVVFADMEARLVCLDATTGSLVWRRSFDAEILTQPSVVDGKVYVIKGETEVLSLSLADGHTFWRKPVKTFVKNMTMRGHARLLADGKLLYAGLADGQLYAFAASDGKIVWSKNLSTPLKNFKDVDADVAIDGDSLYIGGFADSFSRISKNGATAWSNDVATGVAATILSDRVVVSQTNGRLAGFDKANGKQVWFNELNKSVLSQPVAYRDWIFVSSYDRDAYLVDASDGTQVQKLKLSSGSIAAAAVEDDRLYVLTNDGKLMRLSPRKHD